MPFILLRVNKIFRKHCMYMYKKRMMNKECLIQIRSRKSDYTLEFRCVLYFNNIRSELLLLCIVTKSHYNGSDLNRPVHIIFPFFNSYTYTFSNL